MADSIIGYGYESFTPEPEPAAAAIESASGGGIIGLFNREEVGEEETAPNPELADHLLVARLQAGDEAAYEALIARFQQPVYNLVFRLLNDPSEASDVVQEVFLKVFRSVGSFREQSALKTWIYRIAIHESYNHRRWFSRHRRQEVELDAEDESGRVWHEPVADRGYDPYMMLLNEERHQMLEEALREINPIFRSAIVLRDMEDASYEEIAEILQISLGTVKSRILRGREALRKCLCARVEAHSQPATAGTQNLAWMPGVVK